MQWRARAWHRPRCCRRRPRRWTRLPGGRRRVVHVHDPVHRRDGRKYGAGRDRRRCLRRVEGLRDGSEQGLQAAERWDPGQGGRAGDRTGSEDEHHVAPDPSAPALLPSSAGVYIPAKADSVDDHAWRPLPLDPAEGSSRGSPSLDPLLVRTDSGPVACGGALEARWSGRWESNPRNQLGRLAHYHCATPALALRLVARRGFEPLISGLKGRRPSPLDERARRHRLCRKRLRRTRQHHPVWPLVGGEGFEPPTSSMSSWRSPS